jgi:ABC-type Fe3+-hydroxamate transport system substrate-binding protein
MKIKLLLAAMLTLAAAACASAGTTAETAASTTTAAPTPAASVNPVGRFEFTTSVQGQTVTGALEVAGSPGAYTGQITTSITPPIPVTGVTATGQAMVVTGSTPDGALTIRMNFADATAFTGGWELAGDSGSLTGRRTM